MPIVVQSFPLAIMFGLAYGPRTGNMLLAFTLFYITIHGLIFGMRGVACGLAKWHRQPAHQQMISACRGGDLFALLVSWFQFMLLMLTSVLYLQAARKGEPPPTCNDT